MQGRCDGVADARRFERVEAEISGLGGGRGVGIVADEGVAEVDHAEHLEGGEEVCGIESLVLAKDGEAGVCVVQHIAAKALIGVLVISIDVEQRLQKVDEHRVVLDTGG